MVQIQPHMHSPMPWWCNIHQVIFEGLSLRCYELISRFWNLFMEFKFLRPDAISFVNTDHLLQTGSPPRRSFANINVDVAIGPNYSSLALVARDHWKGDLVFACSQKAKTTFPLQAETKAIRWALSLAAKLETKNFIIETDSKICHDVIHELILPPPWRMTSILANLQSLLLTYSNVSIFLGQLIWQLTSQLCGLQLVIFLVPLVGVVAFLVFFFFFLLLLLGRKLVFVCNFFICSIKSFLIQKKFFQLYQQIKVFEILL